VLLEDKGIALRGLFIINPEVCDFVCEHPDWRCDFASITTCSLAFAWSIPFLLGDESLTVAYITQNHRMHDCRAANRQQQEYTNAESMDTGQHCTPTQSTDGLNVKIKAC
jgi:hypothetical protein